jgi:hypothetical protein
MLSLSSRHHLKKMFVGAIFCALALPALADDGKVTVEFYGEGL